MGMGLGGSAVWGFPLFRVPGEIAESTHDVLERWGLGTMGGRGVQNFIMEFLEMFLEFLTCNTNSPKPIFSRGFVDDDPMKIVLYVCSKSFPRQSFDFIRFLFEQTSCQP